MKQAKRVIEVGNLIESTWDNPQAGRVYSPYGIAPALITTGGGRTRAENN